MVGLRRGSGSSRRDRLRGAAIAALEAGPRGVLPILSTVAVLVAAVGALVLELGSASGAHPRENQVALVMLAVLGVLGVAGLVAARSLRATPAVAPPDLATV